LHGNSGCRVEAYQVAKKVCDTGIPVVGFDFSGCGQSEGQYVTLGIKEKHDIRKMIQHLERTYKFKKFILWGRSMGAVASLMYMNTWGRESRIKGLILDSPFSDFIEVCKYYARNSNFGFLLDWGLEAVNDIT
jgi:pimeloyl-ACP methyl ester carboxylesterase